MELLIHLGPQDEPAEAPDLDQPLFFSLL